MRSFTIKRILDVIISAALIILLAPLFLFVGILVRLRLGRPVLFRQVRPGYLAQPFTIWKFRTMRNATDTEGRILPDHERITDFGRFLRSTSLDELPELFNILRGEMSLVGPRPLLIEHLSLYTRDQARRHQVLPGLTGWAQVNGRDSVAWEDKLAMDIWYVDNWSNWLDLKILFWTAWNVLLRKDVVHPDDVGMEQFRRSRGGVVWTGDNQQEPVADKCACKIGMNSISSRTSTT